MPGIHSNYFSYVKEELFVRSKLSKVLSGLLSLSLMASLMVAPASAAETEHSIRADYNGSQAYLENYPDGYKVQDVKLLDIGVGVDAEVTVSSGSFSETSSERPITMSGTLPDGTVYTLTENSSRIVSLSTDSNGLRDDIEVSVRTTPHTYSVEASSGPVGFKDNLGSTSAPTCTVSKDSQFVSGNESWAVTFNPLNGNIIQSLNIRGTAGGQNIVSADKEVVNVGGTEIRISKSANGVVTVSAAHAASDVYVTALTVEKAAQLALTVTTGTGLTSDVTTGAVDAGTSKAITFTPASGFFVDGITITDGKETKVLGATDRSVVVNGHTYKADRSFLNGKVVLSIPAMDSDVTVHAASAANKGYLVIDADKNVTCNYPRVSLVDTVRNHNIRLDTKSDETVIDYVVIETATDRVVVKADTYRFYLDGRYSYVSYDGSVVEFNVYMTGNTRITVYTKDTYHTVTVNADNGAKYDTKHTFTVEDGETEEITFTPVDNETIEKISVTRKGSTTTAKVSSGYIMVNGVRCPITKNNDGSVTVRLKDIDENLTVKAITTAASKLDYTVKAIADKGADFSKEYTYVNSGRSASITFTPSKSCEIRTIVITRGSKEYVVKEKETSVTINGTRQSITWNRNGKVVVDLRNITADMTVEARTNYDAINTPVNPPIDIVIKPTQPTTPTTMHGAYLNGYAGGVFNPYKTTTRAQAVVMMVRAFYGLNDASVRSYGVNKVYEDVSVNEWFAPYISFAYNQGLINGLSGTTGGFRPYAAITRAEFTELACRFSGVKPTGNYGFVFPDVPAAHVNYNYIGYAASRGWANGYTDGNFKPNQVISRAEIAVMTNRVLGRTADKNFVNTNFASLRTFSDIPVGYWAYYDIIEAANTHSCTGNVGSETWVNIG